MSRYYAIECDYCDTESPDFGRMSAATAEAAQEKALMSGWSLQQLDPAFPATYKCGVRFDKCPACQARERGGER